MKHISSFPALGASVFVSFLVAAVLSFQGCRPAVGFPVREVLSQQVDTTAFLVESDPDSPHCHVVMDFNYLQPLSARDTMATRINRTLQRLMFGPKGEALSPGEAMANAAGDYIDQYREDLSVAYEAALAEGLTEERQSPMYLYDSDLQSELSLSCDSIYNFTIVDYEYTGGAHPNTYLSWVNIHAHTGRVLKKEDVFTKGSEPQLLEIISRHLVMELRRRTEVDTLRTLQEFQESCFLFDTDLFVPSNFLITDEGIRFLYNRYEIAPYAMGDLQLTIPYEELASCLR